MRRDYRLYELNDDEFERLVVQICVRWLGAGVTPFAPGVDGGRDGKFHGTANCFPSAKEPLNGHCVLQAKHVSQPNKSCSDREFERLLKKEHSKIAALVKAGICDHYIVFSNRKLTGGADQKLIKVLMTLGLKSAYIVGTERLHLALDDYVDVRDSLPNRNDTAPFRFNPDDLVEVVGAFHDYAESHETSGFDSAHDFDTVKLREEKNKVNGLTADYYQEIIINGSMPHFPRIEDFLKNPRNKSFANLYHDAADELKRKILASRSKFSTFDDVFAFMCEEIQTKRAALRGKRRLVSILLHYMYCNCDIGSKDAGVTLDASDAHA
jgi:ABC-3C protein